MWKRSIGTTGVEYAEITARAVFCIAMYALTAYKLERSEKRQFIFMENAGSNFDRWAKIFETFSEGVAIVRDGEVKFRNASFLQIFGFNNYNERADPENLLFREILK